MLLLLLKALHIIGFTAWFAGLFYLVRMFVYHTEAYDKPQPEQDILRKQLNMMESKVYKIICTPAMLLTYICGTMMIVDYGMDWFKVNGWLHIKLLLIFLLTGYHHYCKGLIQKMEVGKTGFSSFQFRLFNELPSLLLIAIVLLAVFKNKLNFLYAIIGILIAGVLMYLIARVYKNKRETTSK